MEKVITIANKNYNMKASALTQFLYKNETGRSFLKDIQELVEVKNKLNSDISTIDEVSELILKIAYVMTKQADKTKAPNFETFVDGIDNLYDDTDWIFQVIELACSPLSRQLQINK